MPQQKRIQIDWDYVPTLGDKVRFAPAAFANAYNEAMEWLADLYVTDGQENKDKKLEYGKAKRDELIKKNRRRRKFCTL